MLMRTVSGLRGVVGEDLTPDVLLRHTRAFLKVIGARKVAIGRDSRVTGPAIDRMVSALCELSGVDVMELGLATTPTVEMVVQQTDCDGGIIITASHNPAQWNALKFLNSDGTFLVQAQVEELKKIADNDAFSWQPWDRIGKVTVHNGGDDDHVDAVLALPYVNVDLIRSKKFKVAIDAVNGAGCFIFTKLLKKLGCDVVEVNVVPDGVFPRGAEPIPESLVGLGEIVRKEGCCVGFASDPDSDRCALVSEKGRPVGEEYTLAIAEDLVLAHSEGDLAVNLSTSRLSDDIAKKYGRRALRSKVGEINVTEVIRANNCVIGGEGNGGVILPALHCGRDGILAAALVLEWMAEHDKRGIEDFVASLPPYVMAKAKVSVEGLDVDAVFAALKKAWPDAEMSELDGLKLDMPEGWVHVRKSNTEPIVRVMTESAIPGKAEERAQRAGDIISSLA